MPGGFKAVARLFHVLKLGIARIDKAVETILADFKFGEFLTDHQLPEIWVPFHKLDHLDPMVVADSSQRQTKCGCCLTLAWAGIHHNETEFTLVRRPFLPWMSRFIVLFDHIVIFAPLTSCACVGLTRRRAYCYNLTVV